MKDALIIQKAIEEIESKNFGVTRQFLDIHDLIYIDNKPVIARVDVEETGKAIVYFPVKDEKFYLAVYLDLEPEVSVRWVNTESHDCVYFVAISETLSFDELSAVTTIKPLTGWNKGDKKRKDGKILHKYSKIRFEPNPEADEFDDKIKKLLEFLEQDNEGIKALAEQADGHIQVVSDFHNGNTMLGGYFLQKDIVKRLAALNLSSDFSVFAEGNFFKGD